MNKPNSWNELAGFTNVDILCWAVSEMSDAMVESGVKEAKMVVKVCDFSDPLNYGGIAGTVISSDIRKEVKYENRNCDTGTGTASSKGNIGSHTDVT